ncbi:hypothetical protein QO209_17375 [Pseudomonas citronellolis]|uniref:hypothetical protein n=1 Tax=Pseudomonas citronellolis TaxID=53408 RepID=UPI0026494D49|nr:hypothetical protein [Pseudomonas citronellolis]MDN6874216.1 hypothetical protein [Pseudomonas citronellolis]
MDEWVSVSQHELKEVESRQQRGITLQFMISPADMPTAWKVSHLKNEEFVVEFKYLSGPESKTLELQSDGVLLEIGKNSRRIYKIFLDISKLPKSGELMIKSAKDAIEHTRGLNKNNSEVIQKFLSSQKSKPELIGLMTP